MKMNIQEEALLKLVACNNVLVYLGHEPLITKKFGLTQWAHVFSLLHDKTSEQMVSHFLHSPSLYEYELTYVNNTNAFRFYLNLIMEDYRLAAINVKQNISQVERLIQKCVVNSKFQPFKFAEELLSLLEDKILNPQVWVIIKEYTKTVNGIFVPVKKVISYNQRLINHGVWSPNLAVGGLFQDEIEDYIMEYQEWLLNHDYTFEDCKLYLKQQKERLYAPPVFGTNNMVTGM